MKRNTVIICFLLLALFISGCAAQRTAPASDSSGTDVTPRITTASTDDESDTVTTEPTVLETTVLITTTEVAQVQGSDSAENTAFTALAGSCDGSILAVLYNEPFSNGAPMPTVIWNEGEYDRLVIYPRYVGSVVCASRISYDESGAVSQIEEPTYSTVCAEGDSIGAALDRPEGAAAWIVTVQAPNGAVAGYTLNYNGRYGTLAYEYLTDCAASELYSELPSPETLGEYSDVLGADVMDAFLRAAAREQMNPWEAMRTFCAPYVDLGDSAAYTIYQGEMDGDTYDLQAVRLREGYDPGEGDLAARAAAQAELYAEIGNEKGILGVDAAAGENLYVDLTGLTVWNPTRTATAVSVTVNGADAGTYQLSAEDFCTLVKLDFDHLPADVPVTVQVRVVETRLGDPARAILEIWPGVGGNISGAR